MTWEAGIEFERAKYHSLNRGTQREAIFRITQAGSGFFSHWEGS